MIKFIYILSAFIVFMPVSAAQAVKANQAMNKKVCQIFLPDEANVGGATEYCRDLYNEPEVVQEICRLYEDDHNTDCDAMTIICVPSGFGFSVECD